MRRALLSSLPLAWLLCLSALSGPAQARQVPLLWNYAGPEQASFLLYACMETPAGGCVMEPVRTIAPGQTQTQVQTPGGPRRRCFEVVAMWGGQKASPSNRFCLSRED